MITFMKETRERYERERRKLQFAFRSYHRLEQPKWMRQNKDQRFACIYKDQTQLLYDGRIAIASIVQANTLLFSPGEDNCPAAMVYSEDSFFEENPNKLREIAHQLFSIKGKQSEDEELQRFGDILADELVTLYNKELPKQLSYGKVVYFTSIMVHREHLPNGYLDFSSFPVLVLPEKTDATMILPAKYWAMERFEG